MRGGGGLYGRPIRINLSREDRQEARLSVGAGVDDVRGGGLYGRPPVWVERGWDYLNQMNRDAGDHKGPLHPSSSTPAPTDKPNFGYGVMCG
jgi:hypothetical protein